MNKKVFIIVTSIVFLALVIAAIGVSFAWYTNKAGDGSGFILDANGFLVVYFDEDRTQTNDAVMTPAKLVSGALANNATDLTDVLHTGGSIAEAATTGEFSATFSYLNATKPDGSPTPADLTFKCDVFAINGETKTKLAIGRDISVSLTVSGEYVDSDTTIAATNLNWGSSLSVSGDIDITIEVSAYYLQPDELCHPAILEAETLRIVVTITANTNE